MYLVVFFLLVWSLFQCILCNNCVVNNPDPNTLYILTAQNDIDDVMKETFLANYEFRFNTDIRYYMVKRYDCPEELQNALKLTKNLRYVIYYGITDFYKNNYSDVRNSNMEWAGDYDPWGKPEKVCKSDNRISLDITRITHIKGRAIETCSFNLERQRLYTMLISKYINIKETPDLYDLIHSNEYSESNDEHSKTTDFTIISCKDYVYSDRIIFKETFKTIRVRYYHSDTCKYFIPYWDNVIAILAPGPEYVETSDYYADKPFIFYDEISNPTVIDMYENAIIRKTTLEDEAMMLWKLISFRWKRVAILSGGSAENGAFERELRTVFEHKEVSYSVKSVCLEGQSIYCDFKETLSYLQSVDARIIIANVDQQYADSLANQAQKKGMTKAQNIIWIARAWSKATCLRAAKLLGTILTVKVKSDPEDAINMIKGLFEQDYEYSGFLTEAKFAQDIRNKYLEYQDNFEVVRTECDGHQEEGIMQALRNMSGDRGECTLRSDNFDKPCDDMEGIMISLVIVVLAVTILGITYFFDEPTTPYNRMAH